MRLIGDVNLGVNSLIGGAAPAQGDPKVKSSQLEWTPPSFAWHELILIAPLPIQSVDIACMVLLPPAANTSMAYIVPLRNRGIAYDGSDLILRLYWECDNTPPGGGDNVDWKLEWAFVKADGSTNASTAQDDSIVTTVDVSSRTDDRLYKDDLPNNVVIKMAGLAGADLLLMELTRNGVDDTYSDEAGISGMRLVKV